MIAFESVMTLDESGFLDSLYEQRDGRGNPVLGEGLEIYFFAQ